MLDYFDSTSQDLNLMITGNPDMARIHLSDVLVAVVEVGDMGRGLDDQSDDWENTGKGPVGEFLTQYIEIDEQMQEVDVFQLDHVENSESLGRKEAILIEMAPM